MNRKIPADIQDLLRDFIQQITSEKPDLLHGVYVYGSLALGAYNPQKSDVDFIALLTRKCTAEDLQVLAKVHKKISQKYPKNQLDGSYLQANDISKLNDDLAPYPYFDGAFHNAGHYDVNHITWWTLKYHGISIYENALEPEAIAVDWETLLGTMHANLNSYWQDWASNPDKYKLLIFDSAIEWVVLGILRQYYSFKKDAITSKVGAGEYALAHLPDEWHILIRDALHIRNNQNSVYHDKLLRQEIAHEFLQFILAECNIIFNLKYNII